MKNESPTLSLSFHPSGSLPKKSDEATPAQASNTAWSFSKEDLKILKIPSRYLRFHEDEESGCWVWDGGCSSNGTDKRPSLQNKIVYRVIWEYINGPIPPGLFCCHKCDNSLCVNLDHIFLGTQKDNIQDALRKGRPIGRPAIKTQLSAKILNLHTKGHSNYQIAKFLGVDHSTVRYHIRKWKED